jgi:hypothetical protein
MIPLELALNLKRAGLIWRTSLYDFFGIPDRGMDDKIFVLTDVMANVELLQGWPVVAFHGAAEWALDHIFTSEIVWLPTEEQLRDTLAGELDQDAALQISRVASGYECEFDFDHGRHRFSRATASEAYAAGLLYVLQSQNGNSDV